MTIDAALAQRLVREQFPEWADLPVSPVAKSGWDNRTFRLGDQLLIRMPSAAGYAPQVDKEQDLLPKLAPSLPVTIPAPFAKGAPGFGYPWSWSVYSWIDGETAAHDRIDNIEQFAMDVAGFLNALQIISADEGPVAGTHNFFRGGPLTTYDEEVERALDVLGNSIDNAAAQEIWTSALSSEWQSTPVWVHGDISSGNLLVRQGRLSAVIDFGCLGIGDPACDLVMAWTFFDSDARNTFRNALPLDAGTWERARGWALWKALIICAEMPGTNQKERAQATRTIYELISDFNTEC